MTGMIHPHTGKAVNKRNGEPAIDDEFLSARELDPVAGGIAQRTLQNCLAEMEEMIGEKKWQDLVELFLPVEEKLPELVEAGMDATPRSKAAFALGQLGRFDEAMEELEICIEREPDNFHFHSALAYTAYDSLWAAKNRELLLAGKIRAERIALAHAEFRKAQKLRPDGVTNFYRQGMLFKQIQGQSRNALPLFEQAVFNWDRLDDEQKKIRHQEHKNFVKALYHIAGCLVEEGMPKKALHYMKRCLAEDDKSNHFSLLYKYFAMGKILFHLNAFAEARDALVFALKCGQGKPVDFVYELLARTHLALGNQDSALEIINQVPEKRRRPYYRWTEADIFCARREYARAKAVLTSCRERDNRSRHKTLIRLSRVEYLMGDYRKCAGWAEEATRFFRERWNGVLEDGLFWQAVAHFRLGEHDSAAELAAELFSLNPIYPKLRTLMEKLSQVPGKGDLP